jgi:autotransporter-associated beta strand protein
VAGTYQYSGDGGAATNARLAWPGGVAVSPNGDIYVADTFNNCVRMIDPSTGIITTVGGDGTPGDSGDGDAATAAELNGPTAVALNAAGTLLFIADSQNGVIRAVNLSGSDLQVPGGDTLAPGYITTIAGLSGGGMCGVSSEDQGQSPTSVFLAYPDGIAVDGQGNVYVADGMADVVYELATSTDTMFPIAGTGDQGDSGDNGPALSAELNCPAGLALNAAGTELVIADAGNNCLRAVDLNSGTITPVADVSTWPQAVAMDSQGNIYVADGAGTQKVAASGGAVTTVGPGGSGVALDPAGNAIVVGGDTVSQINLVTTAVAPVAGNTSPGDGGPALNAQLSYTHAVAVDPNGDLLVATADGLIHEVSASTGQITTVAGGGVAGQYNGHATTAVSLSDSTGLAVDSSGDIIIADSGNGLIREVSASTGTITTILGGGVAGQYDGNATTSVTLYDPQGVAIDSSNNLFLTDSGIDIILELSSSTGLLTRVAGTGQQGNSGNGGPATSAKLNDPTGVAWYGGSLFIADEGNNVIRQVNSSGTISTVVDGSTGLGAGGDAVTVDSNGDLFISGNDVISEATCSGGTWTITTVAGDGSWGSGGDGGAATSAQLASPTGLAVDSAGDLLIADSENSVIREVSTKSVPTVGIAASASSLAHGQDLTLTATVSPPDSGGDTPTGTVRFFDGTTLLGWATLDDSGEAELTTSTLALGQHDIMVSYVGDSNYFAGISLALPVTVTPIAPSVTTDPTNQTVVAGSTASFTAAASGYPTPTVQWEVKVYDGSSFSDISGATSATYSFTATDAESGNQYEAVFTNTAGAATATAALLTVWTVPAVTTDPTNQTIGVGGTVTFTAAASGYPTPSVQWEVLAVGGSSFQAIPGATSTTLTFTANDAENGDQYEAVFANSAGEAPTTAATLTVQGDTIITVAGNGGDEYSGDGGQAINAQLNSPQGVAVDTAGDLFIADSNNNVIREVNHATGVISTVAGDGNWNYSGDGGAATSAELFDPPGVAVDAAGDIFINDTTINVIREVDHSTGLITRVAGGGTPTTSAVSLSNPAGLAVDSSGDIFIADSSDSLIIEVSASGQVSTVLGGGGGQYNRHTTTAVTLNDPSGVAVDSAGDIFIADSGNNVIREVNYATGAVTTVAGSGANGYSGDGGEATIATLNNPSGVAVDAAGDIFIADSGNNVIREVHAGTITTVAGGGVPGQYNGTATGATLNNPSGVAVDAAGDIFIADSNNNVIREVADKAVPAVGIAASASSLAHGQDLTLTATVSGSVFGGNTPSGTVDFVDGTTLLGSGTLNAAGEATLTTSTLALGEHDIMVSYGGDSSYFAGVSTASSVTVAPIAPAVTTEPSDQTIAVAGMVTFAAAASGYPVPTVQWDVNTGNGEGFNVIPGATSTTLTFTSNDAENGNQYEAVFSNIAGTATTTAVTLTVQGDAILTIGGTGNAGYSGDGGQATSAEFNGPEAVAVDSAGDVFVADTNNNVIREIDHATGQITTVAGGGVPGQYNGTATSAVSLSGPTGVAVDLAGDIFIADSGNNLIREVNYATGVITTIAGGGTSSTNGIAATSAALGLSYVSGLAVDSSGDVFFADSWNNLVRELYQSNGTWKITTVAGDGDTNPDGSGGYAGDGGPATSAELNFPTDVAVDGAGNLFIDDCGNNVIREVSASSGNIETVAGTARNLSLITRPLGADQSATSAYFDNPLGVAVNSAGDIWIADSYDGLVWEVDHSTGDIAVVAGGGDGEGLGVQAATSAQLAFPAGVAVDSAGNLYIADSENSVICEVSHKSVATVSIAASTGSVAYGQDLTFTATVSPPSIFGGDTPTGMVDFYDGTTLLGSGTLNAAGQATLTTSTLVLGQRNIMVSYIGDSSYFGGISVALPVTVNSLYWDGSAAAAWDTGTPWRMGSLSGPAIAWVSGSDAIFPSGSTVTIDGSVTADAITFLGDGCSVTGGTLDLGVAGTPIDVASGTATISATIAGIESGDGLSLAGGTLVLSGDNSYTGTTTIASGTLQFGAGGTIGSIVGVVVDDGQLVFNRSDSLTFGAQVSGTGSVALAGSGQVTLSAANTYTGTTIVDAGTLVLGNALALQDSTLDTSGAGAISFGAETAVTLGGLQGTGGLALQDSSGDPVALTVGGNGASTTFAGPLTGVASGSNQSQLIKAGSGTLTLTAPGTPTSVNIVDTNHRVIAEGLVSFTSPTVMVGMPLTLTAVVVDPFGHCTKVAFYLDVDGSGQYVVGDPQLGPDITAGQNGIWSTTISTAGMSPTSGSGFVASTEDVIAVATFSNDGEHVPAATTVAAPLNITGDAAWAVKQPKDAVSGAYTFSGLAPCPARRNFQLGNAI